MSLGEAHFLWPKQIFWRAMANASRFCSVIDVESRLASMFVGGHPVLVSSGRVALVLALIESRLTRSDRVGVFPYSSHCVLDAVSRVATPQIYETVGTTKLRLVFHQWGYIQESHLQEIDIEDCVDTFVETGSRLFPGGGAFEIWSLPKIVGTTGGGVLWCRSMESAERIRALRDRRGGGFVQWVLRLFGANSSLMYAWWQGGEGIKGLPSRLQTGEIINALNEWDLLAEKRRAAVDTIWHIAPSWLKRYPGRIPCAVPIVIEGLSPEIPASLGISAGMRTMERIMPDGGRELVLVVPIPVHQDVSLEWLNEVSESLLFHMSSIGAV